MKKIFFRMLIAALIIASVISSAAVCFAATDTSTKVPRNGILNAIDKTFLKDFPVGSYVSVNGKACSSSCDNKCANCAFRKIAEKYYNEKFPANRECYSCTSGGRIMLLSIYGREACFSDGLTTLVKQGNIKDPNNYRAANGEPIYGCYCVFSNGGDAWHIGLIVDVTDEYIEVLQTNAGTTNKVYIAKHYFNSNNWLWKYKYVKVCVPKNYTEVKQAYCEHVFDPKTYTCIGCGLKCNKHDFSGQTGICATCGYKCKHSYEYDAKMQAPKGVICKDCGKVELFKITVLAKNKTGKVTAATPILPQPFTGTGAVKASVTVPKNAAITLRGTVKDVYGKEYYWITYTTKKTQTSGYIPKGAVK